MNIKCRPVKQGEEQDVPRAYIMLLVKRKQMAIVMVMIKVKDEE